MDINQVFMKQSLKVYEQCKNEEITSIIVLRYPFDKWFYRTLHVISGFRFFNIMQQLGYTDLYHVNIVFNNRWILNKKGYIVTLEEITDDLLYSPENDVYEILLSDEKQTLETFLGKVYTNVGHTRFCEYHFPQNSCQTFVCSLLEHNGLMTEELKTFICQDAQVFINNIPNILFCITNSTLKIPYWSMKLMSYIK